MNRREFLKSSASLSAATLSPRALRALAPDSIAPLHQLDYSQVQLLDSLLLQQFDHNHALFLALDDDRLLKPFRQLAGMPAPGEDMGGWYSPSPKFDPAHDFTGYVPGHTFGQWVSALRSRLRHHRRQSHTTKGSSARHRLRRDHLTEVLR